MTAAIKALNGGPKTLEETAVAKIGETEYMTLDEAVTAAADGDTIELLADCVTAGFNLSKNLIIDGKGKTITFTQYGIALWGTALSFNNCNVVMTGIGSTPYTAERNRMAICASQNASLTLNGSTMSMDGTGTSDAHAIYFCSNNKLNLNASTLRISNYVQDALEWNRGDGNYYINLTGGSHFISDHNRSGFTGTLVVYCEGSYIDVVSSTGNGSNGSHFDIENAGENGSVVNFNNNGAHGLIPVVPVDPVPGTDWAVSRSKTATNLDASFESRVTLSLPSAEEKLVTDNQQPCAGDHVNSCSEALE